VANRFELKPQICEAASLICKMPFFKDTQITAMQIQFAPRKNHFAIALIPAGIPAGPELCEV
jgi:hypothetical protein